jgi:hypothetical protein
MSKVELDYSNTIIYKITCYDPNVKDVYVGHTTNFVQRKHAHKQSCINEKSPNNKCKLYDVIRNNGGWINWNMEIIHFCNCKNQYEARIKEQEYFVLLNANLNSVEPMRPRPVKLGSDEFKPEYNCNYCNFKCSYNSDWDRHILSNKHIRLIKTNDTLEKNDNVIICTCGKKYKHLSSLCKHKKKCSINQKLPKNNDSLIIELLKQNQDFKQLMIEQNKYMMDLVKNAGNNTNSFGY